MSLALKEQDAGEWDVVHSNVQEAGLHAVLGVQPIQEQTTPYLFHE